MRCNRLASLVSRDRGQSLIETALLLPILLVLAFNAINFGYFIFVALNMAAAPRSGVQYSILGFATPRTLQLADPGPSGSPLAVSYLTYHDMRGVLWDYNTARVRVCTKTLGLAGGSGAVNCCQANSSGAACAPSGNSASLRCGTPALIMPCVDPEPNTFYLHVVDVTYQVTPLIPPFELPGPGNPIVLNLVPSLTFRRQVSMRAMD
jgi:hypothetical protein